MTISAFLTITNPEKRGDLYKECITSALGFCDELVIVDGGSTDGSLEWIANLKDNRIKIVTLEWPQEFDWLQISRAFQTGYENSTKDFCFHLDADFIIHEKDYQDIRRVCEQNKDAVALSYWKHQYILPDRFNLKSRLVIAVNKAKYGDRIRFDSGGDACQPALDSVYIDPSSVPEARFSFGNYEKIAKTEAQIKDDVGRMARAWQSHFGEYRLGGPDDESAYQEWLKMVVGRFKKPQERIALDRHPLVMQETIRNLKPEQWGYCGFSQLSDGKDGYTHNAYVEQVKSGII